MIETDDLSMSPFSSAFSIDDVDAMLPARMLAEPSKAITPLNPSDPARLGYPPTFPIEIALRTSSTKEICEEYGISEQEWEVIRNEPLFLGDLKRALDMLQQEGMSFKLKARLQAEELLKTSWREIHSPDTPPSVRAQLIQATMKWAGYDAPPQTNSALVGTGFSININFTGDGAAPQPRLVNP